MWNTKQNMECFSPKTSNRPRRLARGFKGIEYAFDELYKEYSGELGDQNDQEKYFAREARIQKGLELLASI